LVSTFQAELQKLRVEMAAMKRDAEHYSRQVIMLMFLYNFPLFQNMFKTSIHKLDITINKSPCFYLGGALIINGHTVVYY
jgi:hypothetical protein